MGALSWERSTPAFKEQGLQRVTPHIYQEDGVLEAERAVTETPIETLSQARPRHPWSRLNMMVVVDVSNVGPKGHPGLGTSAPQQCSELALTQCL